MSKAHFKKTGELWAIYRCRNSSAFALPVICGHTVSECLIKIDEYDSSLMRSPS